MATKIHRPIPIERMREYLTVDLTSRTGLRWFRNSGRRNKVGGEAGGLGGSGYFYVSFDGFYYLNSRVVLALTTGADLGALQVDHIDRNSLNNDR